MQTMARSRNPRPSHRLAAVSVQRVLPAVLLAGLWIAASTSAAPVDGEGSPTEARASTESSNTGALITAAERAEAARIAMIDRVAPAVVCIFDEQERGGGSGVIIDPRGYGLTNYHVIAGMLESRRGLGGLNDGQRYPLKVLGIDPGGDVAMFRLSGKEAFPHVPLGDSDAVHVGDPVVAMGNPFLLSEDYTPTVTLGIVSGVNRYQYGAGAGDTLLYSDCIQVDAAINPGNSGGPLFNAAGEVIGINGRISVSLRGRMNVGMGYAITANQIRTFIPGLRAGQLVEHGTLEAVVRDHFDGTVIFTELREPGPAWNVGIRPGDRLIRLDGRDIPSANAYASILGALPADWPVDITFRKPDGTERTAVTRTQGIPVPEGETFEPDPAAEQQAIDHVLERFRKSLTTDNVDWSRPLAYEWTESIRPVKDNPDRPATYRVTDSGDGSVSYGAFDDHAEMRVTDDAVSYPRDGAGQPVSATLEVALRALFAVQRVLLPATEPADLAPLTHCGADRHISPSPDQGPDGVMRSDPYTCICRTPDAQFHAQYCFDSATGQLRLIRITNPITQETTVATLHGPTPFSGRIVVHGPSGEANNTWLLERSPSTMPFDLPAEAEHAGAPPLNPVAAQASSPDLPAQYVLERTVRLFGAQVGRTAGHGSAAIISSNGLLLTVDSALLDGRNVRAVLPDGTVHGVESVFSDRDLQLALLRLTPPDSADAPAEYPYFELDASALPDVGQWVLAAGNPFKVASGAEPASLARGVLGGRVQLDATRGTQDFPYRGDVLVLDAVTSTPGFAGGPLVNADGRLIGLVGRMVQARMTHTMLNYATPIDVLAPFVAQALDPAARRGPSAAPTDQPVYHGIKFFELGYRSNPVYVERVKRGSPAARAGLRTDDLIIAANGRQIAKLAALERVIADLNPGDTLELTVVRDDEVKTIKLTLEAEQ